MAPSSSPNGERVIRIVGEHWIKYVFIVFVYLLLTCVGILLFIVAGLAVSHSAWLTHTCFLAAILLLITAHHWFFTKILGESMARIIITNRRVVWMHESLFFREQMTEYAFDKMKTVESNKRGFLQTVLRYGSLKFESGADLRLVPHPNRVAKDIEQSMGLN